MAVALLRAKNPEVSLLEQERFILNFAKKRGLDIDLFHTDTYPLNTDISKRDDFKLFLYSQPSLSIMLVYDTWVISPRIGEFIEILACCLRHSITLYICKIGLRLDNKTDYKDIIGVLNRQRDFNLGRIQKPRGRPKGSISKSKFDKYRNEIVALLKESVSVSKIAKILGVSRTSLKDYIASRNLKESASFEKVSNDFQIESLDDKLLSLACKRVEENKN